MTNFRISVSLNSFFNDQRSLSYILIDNRFQTIEDLEEHIKQIFKLNADTEICLLSNNHLLPSSEGINILNEDDSVQVTPVAKNFFTKSKQRTRNSDEIEFHSKKRKLSRRRDDSHVALDLSSDERDYYRLEQDHVKTKKKKKNKSIQSDEIYAEAPNDLQNVQKMEADDMYVQEIGLNRDHCNFENSSVQILNVETVRPIKIDENEQKNLESVSQIEFNGDKNLEGNLEQEKNNRPLSETFNSTNICDELYESIKSSADQTNIAINNNDDVDVCPDDTVNHQNTANTKNKLRKKKKLPYFTVGDFLSYAQQLSERNETVSCAQLDKDGNNGIDNNESKILPAPESLFITKRRRRVRKRKSHTNDDKNSFTSQSEDFDIDSSKPGKMFSKPKLHIRFSDDAPDTSGSIINNSVAADESKLSCQETLKSILKKSDTSKIENSIVVTPSPKVEKELISILKKNSNESFNKLLTDGDSKLVTDEDNLEDESTFTENFNDSHKSFSNKITDRLKSIDLSKNLDDFKSTILIKEMAPKEQDIIAFKLYEMNEMYEPQISQWVIGKVLKWYPTTRSIDLLILSGQIQTSIPQGKFDIEDEDITNNVKQHSNIVHLDFMSLIDPKVLLIDY